MAIAPTEPASAFGPALQSAVARAQARQAELYKSTGLRLRLGKILVILGDLPDEELRELRETALLPARRGQKLLEAELLGEVALERGLINAHELVQCIACQVEDRRAGRPHRLIGSLLVERGYLRARDVEACQRDLPAIIRLSRARSRRLQARERDGAAASGARPNGGGSGLGAAGLTALDAAYIKAASGGRFDPDQVLVAVERLKRVGPLLDEPLSLAEYLIVRGVVRADEHLDIVRENRDKAAEPNFMLGTVLVELGYAKPAEVDQALKQRAREVAEGRSRRVGEILIERGTMTAAELEDALRVQSFRRFGDPEERAARARRRRLAAWTAAAVVVAALASVALGPRIRDRVALERLTRPRAALDDRLAALQAVAAQATPAAHAALQEVVADDGAPAPLRAACLMRLAEAGLVSPQRLLALLGHAEPALRAAAAWEAARVEPLPAGLRDALVERAGDADLAVRVAASRSLARAGIPAGRALLVDATAPGSEAAREVADALALAAGQPAAGGGAEAAAAAAVGALEALSGFALGPDPVRWRAWLGLQATADELRGAKGWRPADLPGLLRAADPGVAFVAARALAHTGDRRGADLLVRALDPQDAVLQDALKARGLDARALAPELCTLLALLTGEDLERTPAGWVAWWSDRPRP